MSSTRVTAHALACWECFVRYWDRVTRAKTSAKRPDAAPLLFKYAHNIHLQRQTLCGLRQLSAPTKLSTLKGSVGYRPPLSLGLIRLHHAELGHGEYDALTQ